MTLYVESNFVLELALGQEESEQADRLLVAAEQGTIEIALPAFALSEPFSMITQRARERGRLVQQFKAQVGQLARSSPTGKTWPRSNRFRISWHVSTSAKRTG